MMRGEQRLVASGLGAGLAAACLWLAGCDGPADGSATLSAGGSAAQEGQGSGMDDQGGVNQGHGSTEAEGAAGATAKGEASAELAAESHGESAVESPMVAELRRMSEGSASRIPAEGLAVMEQDLERLRGLDLPASAVGVGDTAPGFRLERASGGELALEELLAKGPVVVMWFRGTWCPYCMVQVKHYAEQAAAFEEAGATLVAISPESIERLRDVDQKLGLPIAVMSDPGNAVAAAYGISFRLGDPLVELYGERFGLKLPERNGDDSWTLPLPAVYIIDRDGVVRYAFLEEDYRKRADPAEVLAGVRSLN